MAGIPSFRLQDGCEVEWAGGQVPRSAQASSRLSVTVGPSRLAGVIIHSANLDRDRATFAAIAGTSPTDAAGAAHDVVFQFDDAQLTLTPNSNGGGKRGIECLVFAVADIDERASELVAAGAIFRLENGDLIVDATWAGGVQVKLRVDETTVETPAPKATLDHVALLIKDLDEMTRRWTAILGAQPGQSGLHPLGTAMASRFLVGERMIEILAPHPDFASALGTRLDAAGEGPYALAVVATDLATTSAAVTASGARLFEQPPHLIVHPADAGGVPIQLTPRVRH